MVEQKNEIAKERKNIFLGMIIVAVFYGILHVFTMEGLLDDPIFANYHENYNLADFLYMRYQEWTSRVFLEAVTSLVLQNFLLWRVLDTLMYVSLFFSIRRVMKIKSSGSIFLAMLICCYIMLQMVSAGWGATSVNFMWTLAAAWMCIVLLQKFTEEGTCRICPYVFYCILMLFACNNEVTAVVMFLIYVILLLLLWGGKKISSFSEGIVLSKVGLYTGLILQGISILFFATAKGNWVRMGQANSDSYSQLTLIGKIRIGLVSTFEHFVSIPNAVFGVFCLALAILIWQKSTSRRDRLIGALPLGIDAILTVYYGIKDIIFGGKRNYVFAEPPMIPESTAEWCRQWFLIALVVILICAVCYTMWKVLGNGYEMWASVLVLAAGCASRMAMAFTPSVYVSGTRTFALLYFSLIAVAGVLCAKVDGKWEKRILYVVLAIGMLINAVLTIIPYLQGHN